MSWVYMQCSVNAQDISLSKMLFAHSKGIYNVSMTSFLYLQEAVGS